MYTITIRTGRGADRRTALRLTGHNDWMRQSMAVAIELTLGDGARPVFVRACRGGSPGVTGTLDLWSSASQAWIDALGELLTNASWDPDTRKGYGVFIERLLALKADWRLAQGWSDPPPHP
jgi:hypothetical protein